MLKVKHELYGQCPKATCAGAIHYYSARKIETWMSTYGPETRGHHLILREDLQKDHEIQRQHVRKEVGVFIIRSKEKGR